MTPSTHNGPVLAIDFGTSFSTMCRLNPSTGIPEVIKNAQGHDKTPSVVYFGSDELLIGESAEFFFADVRPHSPSEEMDLQARTVFSPKRLLRDNLPLPVPDRLVRPVDAVASILVELKKMAEELCLHGTVEQAILTHPVTFTEGEKNRLRAAAEQAELYHVGLLEEPVAAALGYVASGAEVGDNILVYDLGGGTFDLSFVQRNGDGSFHLPLESMGLPACGGDDFDQALYDYLERRCQAQHGVGFGHQPQTIDKHVLHQCRTAKERLTSASCVTFTTLIKSERRDVGFSYRLAREEFEDVIRPLVFQTITQTEQMLARIKDAGHRVDTVLFVGGTTRVPFVQREVAKVLPLPPTKTMYADVAVAMGAAAHGSSRQPRCQKCHAALGEDDRFCTKCGSRRDALPQEPRDVCPRCKTVQVGDNNFCVHCGQALGKPASSPAAAPPQPSVPLVVAECASVHRDGQWWRNYQARVILNADSLEVIPVPYQHNALSAERLDRIALSHIAHLSRADILGIALKRIAIVTTTGERFSIGFPLTHNVDDLLPLLREAIARSRKELTS